LHQTEIKITAANITKRIRTVYLASNRLKTTASQQLQHFKAIVDHTSPALSMHSHHPLAAMEWSRLLLHDVICIKHITVHFQWEGKPQNCPFPMGFCHPAGGGPSHGHGQHA